MKWWETIKKEFCDMNKRNAQRKLWSILPSNWCCVKSKWFFKIKRDGAHRALLLACIYAEFLELTFQKIILSGSQHNLPIFDFVDAFLREKCTCWDSFFMWRYGRRNLDRVSSKSKNEWRSKIDVGQMQLCQ